MMETEKSSQDSSNEPDEEIFKKPEEKRDKIYVKHLADLQNNSDKCNLCIVGRLLLNPFSHRNNVEKTVIVARGRRTPDLKCMLKEDTNVLIRETVNKCYKDYAWLTCCEHKKKMFCWICLLFSTLHSPWCKDGFDDLDCFYTYARRHEKSKEHINNVISMKRFQHMRLSNEQVCRKETTVQETGQDNSNLHETVEKQRLLMMKKLIDINCIGLIESSRGTKLKTTHKNATGTRNPEQCNSSYYRSSDINERITYSLYNLMHCKIKLEIEASPFFSIIINNVTNVSQKSMNAIVFRYFSFDGKVRERLFEVTQCSRSENILSRIDKLLEGMNVKGKFVSLSYDGASISKFHSGAINQIQNKYGILISYCRSHRLNTVLQQSVETLPACRDFFQTVTKLRLFFSQFNRRKQAYFKVMGITFLPQTSLTSLVTEQILEDISVNNTNFMELLRSMSSDKDQWDGSTRIEARGFYETFQELDFKFMLKVFSGIQVRAERLHRALNSNIITDQKLCSEMIAQFISYLKGLFDKFDTVWEILMKNERQKEPVEEKRKNVQTEISSEPYKKLYFEIMDAVSRQVIQRYSEFSNLKFVALLNSSEFENYTSFFPDELFNYLTTLFPFFDRDKLKSQLIKIYNSEFRNISLEQLHKCLVRLPNSHNFDQIIKLSSLILVLPISKIQGASSLSKINSYLVDTGQGLGKKALIVTELDLLKELRVQPSFYNSLCQSIQAT